jgi:hypothetical protein
MQLKTTVLEGNVRKNPKRPKLEQINHDLLEQMTPLEKRGGML